MFILNIVTVVIFFLWFMYSYSKKSKYDREDILLPAQYMSWISVKTEDKKGLIDSLKLKTTYRMSWNNAILALKNNLSTEDDFFSRNKYKLLVVTLPIRGWILILYPFYRKTKASDIQIRLKNLSKRFNESQYFVFDTIERRFTWSKYRDGEVIRYFSCCGKNQDSIESVGDETEIEKNLLFIGEDDIEDTNKFQGRTFFYDIIGKDKVTAIADDWSITPYILNTQYIRSEKVILGYLLAD